MQLLVVVAGFAGIALVFAAGFACGMAKRLHQALRDPGEDIRFPDREPDYSGAA